MGIFTKAILPYGFLANGIHAGIKKKGDKLDLGLFYSRFPAKAACLFTSNKIQAAPLIVCKEFLKKNKAFQAIIANSGNANCFTGISGLKVARDTAGVTAKCLGVKKEVVFVASTGVIGKKLPAEAIKKAIPRLVSGLSVSGIDKAKKAIMTTDTFVKEVTARFQVNGKKISICGIAKGAGMIAPNMATMLAFILTDANISQGAMDKALKSAVDNSFNCITVDGCMSTNDSVIMLANASAKNRLIKSGSDLSIFVNALNQVCVKLARMIVEDAEGATKFITIKVKKAKDGSEARTVALSIANSSLFKTAIYGENPNFGRIVAAVGASGIDIKEKGLRVKLSDLKKKEIDVVVSLGRGKAGATVYTSDLTPEYIKINAEYN